MYKFRKLNNGVGGRLRQHRLRRQSDRCKFFETIPRNRLVLHRIVDDFWATWMRQPFSEDELRRWEEDLKACEVFDHEDPLWREIYIETIQEYNNWLYYYQEYANVCLVENKYKL